MKIDFNAGYQSLQRLLQVPKSHSVPARARANFNQLVNQETSKITENIIKNKVSTSPVAPTSEQQQANHIQKLKSKVPALKPPEVEPAQVSLKSLDTEAVVKAEVPAVKKLAVPSQASTAGTKEAFLNMIEKAGVKHGVDPMISMSVAAIESSFDPKAISQDGKFSKGLFQLLDVTGQEQMQRLGLGAAYNPFDPDQNTNLGVGYLRYLHNLFSSPTQIAKNLTTTPAANSSDLEKLAVAAFNAGEGRVTSAQQRAKRAGLNPSEYQQVEAYLPSSTQDYVQKVLKAKGDFETYFLDEQNKFQG